MFQASKVAVQSCSSYTTCSSCLSAKDPYCGWCSLEKRYGFKPLKTLLVHIVSLPRTLTVAGARSKNGRDSYLNQHFFSNSFKSICRSFHIFNCRQLFRTSCHHHYRALNNKLFEKLTNCRQL